MGPRFCKRGNSATISLRRKAAALQWGHAFVSVETWDDNLNGRCDPYASMGPRFCKRGNPRRAMGAYTSGDCFNGATLL